MTHANYTSTYSAITGPWNNWLSLWSICSTNGKSKLLSSWNHKHFLKYCAKYICTVDMLYWNTINYNILLRWAINIFTPLLLQAEHPLQIMIRPLSSSRLLCVHCSDCLIVPDCIPFTKFPQKSIFDLWCWSRSASRLATFIIPIRHPDYQRRKYGNGCEFP